MGIPCLLAKAKVAEALHGLRDVIPNLTWCKHSWKKIQKPNRVERAQNTFQVHALPLHFGTSIPEHGESINMKKNTSTNKPNSWLAALTFKHLFHPALMPDKMCAPRSVSWYNSCRCHRLHQFQKLLQSLLSGPFVLVCVLSYQKSTVGHIPIIKVFNKHVKKHKEHVSRGSHARVATSPSAQPLAPRGAWCASFPGYPSAL